MRCAPSKEKGLVTTPIVKIPRSLAAFAITGAAPVPVPPPIPAVIKTMWLSLMVSMTSSIVSSAASFPTAGFDPAPNP